MAKGIPGKGLQMYLSVDPASGRDALVAVIKMLNDKDAFIAIDAGPVFKHVRQLRRQFIWRKIKRFFSWKRSSQG